MFKRRPEYFAVAIAGGLLAIAASVATVLSIDTGINGPDKKTLKTADVIVARAGLLTSSSDDEIRIAKARVEEGLVSCGDYVISVKNSDLKASSAPSRKGSVISNVTLASTIDSPEQYTVGIREAAGSYSATGDEVRTDFFVDGSLYYGYLKFNDKNGGNSDYREFVLSWDTADCAPGRHEVYALIRSSDGRGTVISGGEIMIPEKVTIYPNSVAEGLIPSGNNNAWYMIDCGDDDCYIDFAGLSDDIRVSLYDLKGNLIGSNENPGIPYAMLRGKKQDTAAVAEETGIAGVSNCYYICVSRTGSGSDIEKDIDFTMIQSRECAYFDGSYMAVTGVKDFYPASGNAIASPCKTSAAVNIINFVRLCRQSKRPGLLLLLHDIDALQVSRGLPVPAEWAGQQPRRVHWFPFRVSIVTSMRPGSMPCSAANNSIVAALSPGNVPRIVYAHNSRPVSRSLKTSHFFIFVFPFCISFLFLLLFFDVF